MIKKLTTLVALSCAAMISTSDVSGAQGMEELVQAAKVEGKLNVIALPRAWCNYGAVIDSFQAAYGIKVNEIDPDAGSRDAVEAIRGKKGPKVPDVIDVSLLYAAAAKTEGLIQPYKVKTWDTIPDAAKDQDAYWYGGYYGVLSFLINKSRIDEVPRDWPDLLKSNFAGMVALGGDPTQDNLPIQAVYAAGTAAATDTDPSKASVAGLEFFQEMNSRGNLVSAPGTAATVAQGKTPILVAWDYNTLGWQADLGGAQLYDVIIPQTGIVATVFAQAIAANAPHPNAARLWMEHLYSDEGQLMWLKGYCNPVRLNDLASSEKIPPSLRDKLPPLELHTRVIFPALGNQEIYKNHIAKNWAAAMSANGD